MLSILGPGGDSKGLVSTLERGVMGDEHSVTHIPSVFYEAAEFRTPPHSSNGKKTILFSECRKGARFVGDLRRRFVVGEACDLRSDFGQPTQVEFIGREIHRSNFGDIPTIEQYLDSSGGLFG